MFRHRKGGGNTGKTIVASVKTMTIAAITVSDTELGVKSELTVIGTTASIDARRSATGVIVWSNDIIKAAGSEERDRSGYITRLSARR